MVRKLFKHETAAFLRIWLPMQIILLSVALLGRVIQIFESDAQVYSIVWGSSIVTYVIAVIVSLVLITVFSITRFYKNLFTTEGYLSFTLPVTVTQHIAVKAIAAVLFEMGTVISVFISFAVITFGEVFAEVMKAGSYLLRVAFDILGAHLPVYAAEFFLVLTAVFAANFLFFYTCIAIGQFSRKNRALAAVGVYFAFYITFQAIATVFIAIVAVFYDQIYEGILLPISKAMEAHPQASVHVIMCGMLLLLCIFSLIAFAVTRYIAKNRLNLE